MIGREVYPNAPVVLVVMQIRHNEGDGLSNAQASAMKRALAAELPVMRMIEETRLVGVVNGDAGAPQVRTHVFPKYQDRASALAVTVKNDSLTLETTRYLHFERFRDLAARAWSARNDVSPVDGVVRIGLRYIDEIRVPGDDTDWSKWVNPALVGVREHARSLGLTPEQSQGIDVLSVSDQQNIALRYGVQTGYAVDPEGPLRRPTPTPGPYFLIDIDSYWSSMELQAPENVSVGSMLDELHAPVRALFESLITERLREEVLRND